MEKLPNLPVGTQYFEGVRTENTIYVDKTEYIYRLCNLMDRSYFLSRLRRFGKSLTLDTIKELFAGNRALFEGLWIADKWDWSQTFPIIRLSLDAIGHTGGLSEALAEAMHDIAEKYHIELKKKQPGSLFQELIAKIAEKTGKKSLSSSTSMTVRSWII